MTLYNVYFMKDKETFKHNNDSIGYFKNHLSLGWEIKTLNQISENLDSKRVPITKNIRSIGAIPYYGASGIVDYVKEYIFDDDLLLVSEDGANLLARTYPIAFSISGKTWVNNHAHVLRFNNITTQRFVELYLNSIKLDDFISGMAQPKLNQSMLNKILIFFPPLPEQKRIVAILDEALASIAKAKVNAEQNLKNVKEFFKSYLQSVFAHKSKEWEEKTLGEVLQKTETVDPTKKPKEEFLYLDVSSVNKETKEIENATLMMGENAPSRARKLIRTNDVIFATVRPTHSRVALITEEYNEQVCSTGYFVLRAKKFLNNNLVYYFLLTLGFYKQMEKLQKGASYPAVTDSEVKSIIIPFPNSLKEQQVIVQNINALSTKCKKLESIYQQKLKDLEELKKSILQMAFNGELTSTKQ